MQKDNDNYSPLIPRSLLVDIYLYKNLLVKKIQ